MKTIKDEATQKLINSNDGWGKKPITQQTKWNIDSGNPSQVFPINLENGNLESNQSQQSNQSRVTPGQNGTEWWQGDKQSGQSGGSGNNSGHGSGQDGPRKDQWRPDTKQNDQNWPGQGHGQVTNQRKPVICIVSRVKYTVT